MNINPVENKCRAGAPARLPLKLILHLILPVWSGHSCPLLLTLTTTADTTVEERRFSAA